MVMEVKVIWVDFWQIPRKLLFSISNFVQIFIGHPLQTRDVETNENSLDLITVKLQIFVLYRFSYFWFETGLYDLIFVLPRASKQNDVEIWRPQNKTKFSYSIKFSTFFKSTKVRK